MNKTILIAGGTSVVSLAVGAAGGYFIAKKRFEAGLDEVVSREVEATKKYFSVMLMQAKEQKPDSPADIPKREDDLENRDEEELSEADEKVREKGRKLLADASAALTDYQGISTKLVLGENKKPELSTLVEQNIFAKDKSKKTLPPRDEATGKFLPKNPERAGREPEKTPYMITHEEFLQNDLGYNQENCKYFINEKMVILVASDPPEEVEIGKIGEVNLTLFPEVPEGHASIICVRNEALQMDYEIQLTHESLTKYVGLGEDDDEFDDAAYL